MLQPPFSVVISIIYEIRVLFLKEKSYPPITVNGNSPKIPLVAFQRMKAKTGQIHILRSYTGIQSVKYSAELSGMCRLNSFGGTAFVEGF